MSTTLVGLLTAALAGTAAALAAAAALLHRARRQLAAATRQAASCPLTGLANRQVFTTRLAAALQADGPVAVALIDVDRLKHINDHHGHQAGDQVLMAIADRLRWLAPPVRLAARLSGDEFALLITAGPGQALAAARTTWHTVAETPVPVPGRELPVRISIGVASHRPGITAAQLLHHADTAMYQAKTSRTGVRAHTGDQPQPPTADRPAQRHRDQPHTTTTTRHHERRPPT